MKKKRTIQSVPGSKPLYPRPQGHRNVDWSYRVATERNISRLYFAWRHPVINFIKGTFPKIKLFRGSDKTWTLTIKFSPPWKWRWARMNEALADKGFRK